MIEPKDFFLSLKESGVGLFAGVPDSLLKSFCACVDDYSRPGEHIIAANEGNAIAVAAGYHMATGSIAAVYMQNSGLGNAINPLTSLVDPEVYRIPLLMIIGWRGEPGVKDEPQHVKQGRITTEQLRLLGISYEVLDANSDYSTIIDRLLKKAREQSAPVALLVRKGSFDRYESTSDRVSIATLKRENALRTLLELSGDNLIVSTTGKTSREVYELRIERGESQRDFLTVGGMGHTLSIALGVAIGDARKRVVCIDGDGSALMHLGAIPVVGDLKPENLLHVILNNSAHESVGGQPTVAGNFDFQAFSKASGYSRYESASDLDQLKEAWKRLASRPGPAMLEVKIAVGSRDDLGRPTSTPEENKNAFMRWADSLLDG